MLGRNPLHINQHAYQSGKLTDTALNSVVSTIEKALQTQKIGLGAFLDIEGAFDRTSIEAISSALLGHRALFERWIASMLGSRCNISSLIGETRQVTSVRDVAFYCPCHGA